MLKDATAWELIYLALWQLDEERYQEGFSTLKNLKKGTYKEQFQENPQLAAKKEKLLEEAIFLEKIVRMRLEVLAKIENQNFKRVQTKVKTALEEAEKAKEKIKLPELTHLLDKEESKLKLLSSAIPKAHRIITFSKSKQHARLAQLPEEEIRLTEEELNVLPISLRSEIERILALLPEKAQEIEAIREKAAKLVRVIETIHFIPSIAIQRECNRLRDKASKLKISKEFPTIAQSLETKIGKMKEEEQSQRDQFQAALGENQIPQALGHLSRLSELNPSFDSQSGIPSLFAQVAASCVNEEHFQQARSFVRELRENLMARDAALEKSEFDFNLPKEEEALFFEQAETVVELAETLTQLKKWEATLKMEQRMVGALWDLEENLESALPQIEVGRKDFELLEEGKIKIKRALLEPETSSYSNVIRMHGSLS